MHEILLDDLTYMSLALIQKSTFQEPQKLYRNHIFKVPFMENVIKWMIDEKERVRKEKPYAEPV